MSALGHIVERCKQSCSYLLRLFIHEPTPALKDNPLALLFSDDALFSSSDDGFNRLDYLPRHLIAPSNSLRVPLKMMRGVAVEVGLKPKTSP